MPLHAAAYAAYRLSRTAAWRRGCSKDGGDSDSAARERRHARDVVRPGRPPDSQTPVRYPPFPALIVRLDRECKLKRVARVGVRAALQCGAPWAGVTAKSESNWSRQSLPRPGGLPTPDTQTLSAAGRKSVDAAFFSGHRALCWKKLGRAVTKSTANTYISRGMDKEAPRSHQMLSLKSAWFCRQKKEHFTAPSPPLVKSAFASAENGARGQCAVRCSMWHRMSGDLLYCRT